MNAEALSASASRTLLVLRHAKSSWKNEGLADHDRPLSSRGKRDAVHMGREIQRRGLVPDLIICSTAKRARSTVKRILREMNADPDIQYNDEIYLGDIFSHLQALSAAPDEARSLMIVGHNPTLEELVHLLTGRDIAMPTAALACIDLTAPHWSALRSSVTGRLRLHLVPRELTS